ncbi:MAG: cyanophycinase [Cyanobacteria bacterium J06635_15]
MGNVGGPLVIIGGAEDREDTRLILREFVRRAGGIKARITVITAATTYQREAGEEYTRLFKDLGAEDVQVVITEEREDADEYDVLEAIAETTGIFFTGGDQSRVIRLIKDTLLDDAIHKRHRDGAVVAGTSAGAAIMPDVMIIDGDSDTHPRLDAVELGGGMGFLTGILVDQHFAQRGRLGRLLTALLMEPSVMGLGIDENTAVIVEGDELEVIGEGAVTVVDESDTTYNNLDRLLRDDPLAVFGVKLHILPHGYRFNLTNRHPIAKG